MLQKHTGDKAWLNAILYTMHKSGLTSKNWRIGRGINQNHTATIKTKYGPTRTISIKDSIRQGGVISVIDYANLIDDISKELNELTIANQKLCLLWMDDVALIHHDKEELRRMLNTCTTNELANIYHIKFGKEKSQSMTINGKTPNTEITI